MSEKTVSFAVRGPKSLIESLDEYIPTKEKSCSVKKKVLKSNDNFSKLNFEFETIDLVWACVQIGGNIAIGVASNIIYSFIQSSKEGKSDDEITEITVRFPDGSEVIYKNNTPVSYEEIKIKVTEHGGYQ